jgi:5-methylcytosine-specific restriction endonuclease McrA
MKLRNNEYCPIHGSRTCCGRKSSPGKLRVQLGLQRIEDPSHPRGYREYRSPAEMRRLLKKKIVEQDRRCALCGREFRRFSDAVPDHIEPKGMGGARRDDHPENIQAVHRSCNLRKGSKRVSATQLGF